MVTQAKLLLIEDDDVLRGTILKYLNSIGYSIDGVASGPEALDKSIDKLYDLIIADVRLPGGIDGIEVVKRIKEGSVYGNTKSIIITRNADIDAPRRAIKIKVDPFLWKPFKLDDFIEIISYNVKNLLKERIQK